MDITATQIAAWADKNEARAQLPALLRRLVTTTGANLSKVDFPAYDNSQRHGWDGYVETDTATPWIPSGTSGWEFGCNQDPSQKADDDYSARVRGVPAAERKNMTFVFVTPRNWPGKDAWAKRKAREALEGRQGASTPATSNNGSSNRSPRKAGWPRSSATSRTTFFRSRVLGPLGEGDRAGTEQGAVRRLGRDPQQTVVNWLKKSAGPALRRDLGFRGGIARLSGVRLGEDGRPPSESPIKRSCCARRRPWNGPRNLPSNFIAVLVIARGRDCFGRAPQDPAHDHRPQAERRRRRARHRARSRR